MSLSDQKYNELHKAVTKAAWNEFNRALGTNRATMEDAINTVAAVSFTMLANFAKEIALSKKMPPDILRDVLNGVCQEFIVSYAAHVAEGSPQTIALYQMERAGINVGERP